MEFSHTPRTREFLGRVQEFMHAHVYPNEMRYYEQVAEAGRWGEVPLLLDLQAKARTAGLWNLFLPPPTTHGPGLTNVEYAPLCEAMGRIHWSSQVFNCSAPDTGNMETLERFGTGEQKRAWLEPLLSGEIRSAFAMTEPAVASSDATNIETAILRDGDDYVINGRKWWISGAGDARCRIFILMGKTDPEAPRHRQQSMILVPRDTPGVRILRPLSVFGYDDAPHGHMEIVKYLVQHQDTDVLAKDNDGLTALAVAMEAGHRDVGVVLYANMSFSRGSSPYSSMRVRRPVSSASRGSTPTSSTPAATSTSTKTPPPIGPTPPQRTRRKSVDK